MLSESGSAEIMSGKITLHGIDGCSAGWLVVSLGSRKPTAKVYPSLDPFGMILRNKDVVAIDMPIGFPDSDTSVRGCDRMARRLLGRRHVCVFSPPCREALGYAEDYPEASRKNRELLDRGLSKQSHALFGKIAELDIWLRSHPAMRSLFHEVHPELSFAHWRHESEEPGTVKPFDTSKKSPAGKRQRRNLIEARWPGAIDYAAALLGKQAATWAMDDLYDAFACLWTARRIAGGNAVRLPTFDPPPTDAVGLPMVIHA